MEGLCRISLRGEVLISPTLTLMSGTNPPATPGGDPVSSAAATAIRGLPPSDWSSTRRWFSPLPKERRFTTVT